MLANDTQMSVLQANKSIFYAQNGETEDKVKQAFGKKEKCSVVLCSSAQNSTAVMFPLIKVRKEGKMASIHFELITDPSNVRKIK